MEKGEMRVEANVSVSKGSEKGTKVELKNLNSFRNVEKAIEYEIARQIEVLEEGGVITQETRGWDDKKEVTFSQRKKESSHDYRYFPDPDLPKLYLNEIEEFKNLELPELPWEKRERYKKEYGIKGEDIEIYVRNKILGNFFENTAKFLVPDLEAVNLVSNVITTDIVGMIGIGDEYPIWLADNKDTPKALAELIQIRRGGEISSNTVTKITKTILENRGGNPRKIIENEGLLQKSDEGELKKIIEKIIKENEKAVTEYKQGKEASLKFLIGQGMKESRGSANPQILDKLFRESLKN
jgi:aspartyl-tRNA(Asn)/glutamyl-tRNA(Gln) amidotransferase subunit B